MQNHVFIPASRSDDKFLACIWKNVYCLLPLQWWLFTQKKKCDEKFHRKMFLHNLHIVSRWRNLGHASRRRGEEMIRGDLDNFLTRNWMLSWLDCCCWTTKKWGSKADCKAHPTGKIAYTIPQIRELSSFPNNF